MGRLGPTALYTVIARAHVPGSHRGNAQNALLLATGFVQAVGRFQMGDTGLEPVTSTVTISPFPGPRRLIQLLNLGYSEKAFVVLPRIQATWLRCSARNCFGLLYPND